MHGGAVRSGGRIKLRGASLENVRKVVFRGGRGARDDVSVNVRSASDNAVAVPVPMRAQSGPVDAYAGKSVHATSNTSVRIVPPPAP